MPFYNYELDKKGISGLISDCHRLLGRDATLRLLDDLKDLGFKAATRAALSFSKDDMRVPESKVKILEEAQKEIERIEKAFQRGVITDGERYLKVIDLWTHARERLGQDLIKVLREDIQSMQGVVGSHLEVVVRVIHETSTSGKRRWAGPKGPKGARLSAHHSHNPQCYYYY